MSYLDRPRINFAGKFAADPSTIDNDRNNFVVGAPLNVLWNPMGTHVFQFLDCTVRSAVLPNGSSPPGDPLVGAPVESPTDVFSYPAKLVDLDPDQQSVSQIWGLVVRVSVPDPTTPTRTRASMTGEMPATSFADMWTRVRGGSPAGIPWFSAVYQSVLTNVRWHQPQESPTLAALHAASRDALSIRFIVDSYQANSNQANFGRGRLVGTIGPAYPNEPTRFVAGRRLSSAPPSNLPSPPYGAVPGKWDPVRRRLTLDLGNFVPTLRGTAPTVPEVGWPVQPSKFQLALAATPPAPPRGPPPVPLPSALAPKFAERTTQLKATEDPIPAQTEVARQDVTILIDRPIPAPRSDPAAPSPSTPEIAVRPGDYETWAGIVEVTVPADMATTVDQTPLALVDVTDPANPVPAVQEDPTGLYVDISRPFSRLYPGQSDTVILTALRFGQPAPGLALALELIPQGDPEPNNTPVAALPLPASVTTGGDGTATLNLTAGDPGTPRAALNIDGQVYFIGGPWMSFGNIFPLQGAAVSVLVFSGYNVPANPSWNEHIQPIFAYYAQVYPYMKTILDLADRETVVRNAEALYSVLRLPVDHPHYMPILRDLSDTKRETILRWLADPNKP
jgi:hypothetical protein